MKSLREGCRLGNCLFSILIVIFVCCVFKIGKSIFQLFIHTYSFIQMHKRFALFPFLHSAQCMLCQYSTNCLDHFDYYRLVPLACLLWKYSIDRYMSENLMTLLVPRNFISPHSADQGQPLRNIVYPFVIPVRLSHTRNPYSFSLMNILVCFFF